MSDHDITISAALLTDAFDRVHESVTQVLRGLDPETVLWQPNPQANSIGWLIWHLSRVQDDHLTGLVNAIHPDGAEQVWTSGGWAQRFGLPYPTAAQGYGQSPEEVAAFSVGDGALLTRYADAVHQATLRIVEGLTADDYSRIVDERFDPPVTAAVRLVSVVNDTTQHVGQAAYVRGLHEQHSL